MGKCFEKFHDFQGCFHKKIAEKYEVSGASIGNAIQFSWLSSKRDLRNEISELDIEAGLLREMAKEGRAVK